MIESRRLRITGAARSEHIVQFQENLIIGRAVDNDIVLEDVTLSRYHVLLFTRSEDVVLIDLDSTNGTFVNGTQALPDEQVRLADGM